MKGLLTAAALSAALYAGAADATPEMTADVTPVDYVSTLVGTQSKYELSTGNTLPAVAMPWGMNSWTPQTGRMGDGWVYTYDADHIRGFKQTHRPSPWINDYGQFAIMPVTGQPVFAEDDRMSWFSHKAEKATPYYYRVYLADHDVTAEIAPTERAAAMRFTFPRTDSAYVVIDALDRGSAIAVDEKNRRITGYNTRNSGGVPEGFRNYFVVEFDTPFTYTATVADSVIMPGARSVEAAHTGAIVGFRTERGQRVNARVASSFISPEQALLNLRELGDGDLDRISSEGRARWNDVLGRVEVEPDASDPFSLDRVRTFYSNLYRALLFPHAMHETDAKGRTVHYSPYDGKVHEGYMYTDTGFWDTFRALFPLLNLLYPSENAKIQQGLVNAYRESGFLPEWASPGHRDCMVGNNSASIVADAWLSGVRGYDIETLWEAVTSGAHKAHPTVKSTGRLGHELYDNLGYVPCDAGIHESAARTLEYAYDDWCIYRLGKVLGKPESEIKPYAENAKNYRNLFDAETRLMRGRRQDGTFQTPFNPLKWGDVFTEGNAWHYTWSVFHDPQGLIDLMGGDAAFTAMLDSVYALPPAFDDSYYGFPIHEIREMQIMDMGNYAHGNQPIQHMPYLYNWAGQPWKTQRRVREVMDKLYTAAPDGYCGDEDNGQTSAWYVFSALGFYPVAPGTGEYALGAPLFRKARLHLENGKTVEIDAPENTRLTPYVERIVVAGSDSGLGAGSDGSGCAYELNYLRHSDLMKGMNLRFDMSEKPNTQRGTALGARPYSFSRSPEERK